MQSQLYASNKASLNISLALLRPYGALPDLNTTERSIPRNDLRQEPEAQILAGITLFLISITSLLENVCVLMFCLSKEMRTTTNAFTFVLSAADLLVTLLSMPMTTYTLFAGKWPFSVTLCKVWGFVNILTISGSVISLCNISISRYVMVCRPHRYRQIYKPINTALMIGVSTGASVIISILSIFGWSSINYNSKQYICISDWSKSIAYSKLMIACFGAPLVIMLVSNSLILRQIRRNNTRVDWKRRLKLRTIVKCISGLTVRFHKQPDNIEAGTSNRNPDTAIEEAVVYTEGSDDVRLTLKINVQPRKKVDDYPKNTYDDDEFEEGEGEEEEANEEFREEEEGETIKAANRPTKELARCHSNNVVAELRATSASNMRKTSVEDNPVRKHSVDSHTSNEIRLRRMLFIAPIVYATCWTPFCVSMLTSAYSSVELPVFHSLTLQVGYLNCCVNPVIYGLFNTNFYRKFKEFCCKI